MKRLICLFKGHAWDLVFFPSIFMLAEQECIRCGKVR